MKYDDTVLWNRGIWEEAMINGVFGRSLTLFFQIGMDAAHDDVECNWRGEKMVLKRGQMISTYASMAGKFKISKSFLQKAIEQLITAGWLSVESYHEGSLITVNKVGLLLKWHKESK